MVTIIIIDYKTIKKSINYIKQLEQRIISDFDIVLVNNDSKESDLIELKKAFGTGSFCKIKELEVVLFEDQTHSIAYYSALSNLGFAKGNNIGAQIADALFCSEYYVFSNNDIIIPQHIDLNILTRKMNSDVAVIGPKVIDLNGNDQSPRKKISGTKHLILQYWNKVFPKLWGKGDLIEEAQMGKCYWVSGCFMIVKAKPFKIVKGFDTNTFLYAEEMILSEKLLKKGYECFYDNSYSIIHEEGGTTEKFNSDLKIMELMFKSNCYYYKKYRNASSIFIAIAKLHFVIIFKAIYPLYKKIKSKELI